MPNSSKKLEVLRHAIQAKSASFFETSVRHIFLMGTELSNEEAHALLRLCPRIVSLAIPTPFAKPALLPILQGMTRVRKWSGNLEALFGTYAALDLGHAFFRALTHVDIYDDDIENEEMEKLCPGIAALPALTHLCLSQNVSAVVLQRLLEQCMHLQVLVNLWEDAYEDRAREIASSPPVADPRYMVSVYVSHEYLSDWEVGVHGGIDFWAAADVFVARKRRGEIEGTSSIFLFA